ncbi:MAG: DUF6524 family protein [Gammaproteobacteria bacterium]
MTETTPSAVKIKSSGVSREFTLASFAWRYALALGLVLITYNPSQFSAFHWIRSAIADGEVGAVHFLVGVLLLIGWAILWVATWKAMDTLGVVLAILALVAIVWVLISLGVLTADSASAITWIVLVCLGSLLAIGLSWSHLWRRLTGQYTVDED